MLRPWFALLATVVAAPAAGQLSEAARFPLHRGWQIQSSCQAKSRGEEISTLKFAPTGWHHAEVPTTVVAALVADKTYPDPYFGMNLKSLPGMDYSSEALFANQAMPAGSPFDCPWWFRTEFTLPPAFRGRNIWLHFDGINYRANIWLNGEKIADAQDVAGMMRLFEFPVGKLLLAGKSNVLAVEVSAPGPTDLAMTWVDWNPTPPDKNLGLWKDVYLTSTGDVSLRHPFVTSRLDPQYKTAALTLRADLQNSSDHPLEARLRANLEDIHLSQPVTLAAGESRTVSFTPDEYLPLNLAHPRLWWPYQMGNPELYQAKFTVETSGQLSDSAEVRFGIREVTSQLVDKGYRLFRINGRNLLVRGAAWAPDMLLRWSPERAEAGLNYTRNMNLNAIRLEGRMERDEFFDLADRLGILIMPGWTCCDAWEKWGNWSADQMTIAGESLADQMTRLRNHPSVFVWLYGSDNPPPANVETMYLEILQEKHWPNPSVSSASATPTTVTGASGVKMTGPYEYVPPNYWLTDKDAGGSYGYNTETSPGPAIPTLESLERFIPAGHLWPIDEYWNYHAGLERFTNIDRFRNALAERYGLPQNLEDFLRKSEAANYEAERAMFEAYARNKYISTGVIQWMLNNAWPSLIWHLYDYYLVPAGGYFGTKKACEPLHVQYSYDDNSVAVISGYDHPVHGAKVRAWIYDLDAKEKAAREVTLDLAADSSVHAMDLPAINDLSTTYFLKLELRDAAGGLLSQNFYWLSTKPDVLDWSHKLDTVYTPESGYADLTGLAQLPPVKVSAQAGAWTEGKDQSVRVTLHNPTTHLAFMVHLRIADAKSGGDVVPIFWDDNYFSLVPGEKREVSARFAVSALAGRKAVLLVDGWNVRSLPRIPLP